MQKIDDMTVYKLEAVDKIEYDDGEFEEERMVIGFFDSLASCNEVENDYRSLPGFSLSSCRFEANPYSFPIENGDPIKSVFIVQEWIFDENTGNEEITEIGVYLSLLEAGNAKYSFLTDKYLDPKAHSDCVHIDEYVINERHWQEGFDRVWSSAYDVNKGGLLYGKQKDIMKKSFVKKRKPFNWKRFLIIFLAIVCGLYACFYTDPPEGWTRNHHSYEEALEYAKSVDPYATVSREYTDSREYDLWDFREWDATIRGIHCHVASVSDYVYGGLLRGEFPAFYYRIDTDYDVQLMYSMLSEQDTCWTVDQDLYTRYHYTSSEPSLRLELEQTDYRMLNDDELEKAWQEAFSINEKYEKLALDRKTIFCIQAPELGVGGNSELVVLKDSYVFLKDFSEKGKEDFFKEYKKNWALLESGLPVKDD